MLTSPLAIRMLDSAPPLLPLVYDGIWMEVESLGEPDSLVYVLFVTADDVRHLPLSQRIFLYGDINREEGTIVSVGLSPMDDRLLEVCRKLMIKLFLDRIPYIAVEADYHHPLLRYRIGRSPTQIDFIVRYAPGWEHMSHADDTPVTDIEWARAALRERVRMYNHHSGIEKMMELLARRGTSFVYAPGLNDLLSARKTPGDLAAWLRSMPADSRDNAMVAYGRLALELF